uniref:Peptidase M16 N-terminal domain-containing protein n=1 Tax=viral metagenome TaxID=1070528 RepID=A0A6C0B5N9_9ZZZZ
MKTRTYDNGFRVVHEKSFHGSQIASIQVICDVGSIHEPADSRGAAHFIEHMCFKGTPTHPSSYEISSLIDKTGSYVNAFTDRRYTKYYINTTTEHVPKYINLLSDMLLNSVFDKGEYAKERNVVKEEMIQDADDAEETALKNADAVIFAGSHYEYPVDELKYHSGKHALQYDKLVEMYRTFYIPNRMILSVCSANSFDAICEAVQKSWFTKKVNTTLRGCPPAVDLTLTPQQETVYKIAKMPINPAHICVGFRTCSIYDADRYSLKMLKKILSGSMSSRMFMILREENGLTYSSYTESEHYENAGNFVFYAECDSTKVFTNGGASSNGVYPLIMKLIHDLVKDGITKEELEIAKSSYRGTMAVSRESAESIASYNAKNILYQRSDAPSFENRYKTYVDSMTVVDINACIKKYFRRENMVVSVVGRAPPSQKMLEKYV